MSWKEFFRPSKQKFVLFVVVSLIFYSGYMILFPNPIQYFLNPAVWFGDLIFPYYPYALIKSNSVSILTLIVLSIILMLLYWYVVSCIIFWIYHKWKKKQRKK
jgi:hypothetical protein